MSNSKETVCAVVVTYNRKDLLFECLESLLKQTFPLNAIYIVDNASTDGTPQALMGKRYIKDILTPVNEPLESEKEISLLSDGNKNKKIKVHYVRMDQNTGGAGGFAEGVKRAYERGYSWLWMMDDDSDPVEDSLEKLAEFFERKDISALAGAVVFHSGKIFYGTRGTIDLNRTYPMVQKPLSPEAYDNKEVMIDMASFVGILVSSKAVEKIGFPRKELFIFHDDVEYCIRLRKVGKILLVPDSKVVHREPAKEGIEKSFLGRKALRVPFDKFWLTYFRRRNLVWLGKEYSTSKIYFYFGTLNSILRLISGVIKFDDNKIRRIIFLVNAYVDGIRGNFNNEKPKKILYGNKMQTRSILSKFQWIIRRIISSFGIDLYQRTDDRHVLETIIFPYIVQRNEFSKVLFVGCGWYTKGYKKTFKNKKYWTLEIDQIQSKYGATKHITDSLENVSLHFSECELDLIICNGVFGWGLDAKDSVEKAFQGCFECLRSGGVLVLGWNDIPERRPFPLEECQSLKFFRPYVFPPLSTSQYITANPNRHIYNFYVK